MTANNNKPNDNEAAEKELARVLSDTAQAKAAHEDAVKNFGAEIDQLEKRKAEVGEDLKNILERLAQARALESGNEQRPGNGIYEIAKLQGGFIPPQPGIPGVLTPPTVMGDIHVPSPGNVFVYHPHGSRNGMGGLMEMKEDLLDQALEQGFVQI